MSVGGAAEDQIILCGVAESNPDYKLPEDTIIGGNWFDEETGEPLVLEYPEGYFSIKDSLGDLMKNPQTAVFINQMSAKMRGQSPEAEKPEKGAFARPDNEEEIQEHMKMMQNVSLMQLMKMAGPSVQPKDLVRLNQALIKIKK